jgi:ketosteroid isomerase-like protein
MARIDEVREAVEAAGQRHYTAASACDTATIDELFCEDVAYSHSNGVNTPKAEYMQMVAEGNYRTLHIDHSVEDMWLLADDVAVVRGSQLSSGRIGGVVMNETKAASLDVWCFRDDRWQLLAHHMTLVVENGAWTKAFKESHIDA